jgi:hypothetical protein
MLGMVRSLEGPVGIDAGREILRRVRQILVEERALDRGPEGCESPEEWSRVRAELKSHRTDGYDLMRDLHNNLALELADEAAEIAIENDGSFVCAGFANMVEKLQFRRDMHREFDL